MVTVDDKKLLKMREIVEIYGIPKSTVYYLIRLGKFPKQIRLSERSVAWKACEVADWFESLSNQGGE